MAPFADRTFGNPSSVHRWGRAARGALEDARAEIAYAIGAKPSEVFFVRGGTESDNIALLGWLESHSADGTTPRIAVSTLEHHAVLEAAETAGVELSVVDASADFRFADADAYAQVYGHAHAAPALLPQFRCAVPEHLPRLDTPHAAHPGCFATAMLLGIVPLLGAGLTETRFFASAVTGSTGAGKTPRSQETRLLGHPH